MKEQFWENLFSNLRLKHVSMYEGKPTYSLTFSHFSAILILLASKTKCYLAYLASVYFIYSACVYQELRKPGENRCPKTYFHLKESIGSCWRRLT